MTDRELLEKAAKSAHLCYVWRPYGGFIDQTGGPVPWNPLTDDGDALRLAVKLHMSVSINSNATDVYDGERSHLRELHHANAGTATRRAITRAAAEIQLHKEFNRE